jgi:hypothetical protein
MTKVKEGCFSYETAKSILGECSLQKKSIYVRDEYSSLNYGHFRTYGYKAVYEDRFVWVSLTDNSLYVDAKI